MSTLFNIPAHHSFVQRHGDDFRWYRALLCPCGATGDPGRARVDCMHCLGQGVRYESSVILRGIITGIQREKNLIESGMADPGDMILGMSPTEAGFLSDYDMIELNWTQGQPFQGDVVTRRAGLVDLLSYPAIEVFSCSQIDYNTQNITTYVRGVHFTTSGRSLTWVIGQPQPTEGQIYSIKYSALLQWVCFRSPFDRREGNVNLGQKILLKKRITVGVPSFIVTNNPFVVLVDQVTGGFYHVEFGQTIDRIATVGPGVSGWLIQSGWWLVVNNGVVDVTTTPVVGAIPKNPLVDLSVVGGVLMYNPPV